MTLAPFRVQAASQCPPLDSLLLAASAEFRPVDVRRTRATLDRLATQLRELAAAARTADDQAEAISRLLIAERLCPAASVGPDDAMLDSVAERGIGHPALLAVLCVEAGRRAGLPVTPIGTAETVLVGVRDRRRPIVIDPSSCEGCPLRDLAWQCSHEVAYVTLTQLARLHALHGRVTDAIHAAELRAVLPISGKLRQRVGFESEALRAQFN
jgi:regulator of sirC expression with transglutaminase-like and TPR domain